MNKIALRHPVGIADGHDFCSTRDRGQGHAAAGHLRVGGQVGRHAVVLLSAAVGQPKPRHHLVEDERDLVVRSDGAEPLEKARDRRQDPLHRLDDHGRQFIMALFNDGSPSSPSR